MAECINSKQKLPSTKIDKDNGSRLQPNDSLASAKMIGLGVGRSGLGPWESSQTRLGRKSAKARIIGQWRRIFVTNFLLVDSSCALDQVFVRRIASHPGLKAESVSARRVHFPG